MLNIKNRSNQYELLDEIDNKIAATDLYQNLKELDFINTYLGGHAITTNAIKNIFDGHIKSTILIAEIGCGGGDNLRHIANYFSTINVAVELIGIDLKQDCIKYAKETNALPNIKYYCSSYEDFSFAVKPDIIFSSLFCHHFSVPDIKKQLLWMQSNCFHAFFINDLQRNPIAYYSIKFLTNIFSKSYLVKHDAPLSVLRAYSRKEWQSMLNDAQLSATIQWKWAFRFLIIYRHAR
jgi:2-polyprenyl-3-methyl-5-hydroxy-6-metoxy-1,4-benzoquinol methylase